MIAKVEIEASRQPGSGVVKINGVDVASCTRAVQVMIGVNSAPEVRLLLIPKVHIEVEMDIKLLLYGPFLNALRELVNSHDRSGAIADRHISPQRMLEIRNMLEESEAAMELGPRANTIA